jgi:DNA invertase Pin-like site-specific DNA recombinase
MKKGAVRNLPKHPVETQKLALAEFGIPAKDIWVIGEGANDATTEDLLRAYRRPGDLYLAADLRVLGQNRKQILGITDGLEKRGVKLHDIAHPEDGDRLSKMLERALAKIAEWARWKGSKATAKATGRRGGLAKAKSAEAQRATVATEDVMRRLCSHPKLSWDDCEFILGIPKATLRRHYAPPARKQKK